MPRAYLTTTIHQLIEAKSQVVFAQWLEPLPPRRRDNSLELKLQVVFRVGSKQWIPWNSNSGIPWIIAVYLG